MPGPKVLDTYVQPLIPRLSDEDRKTEQFIPTTCYFTLLGQFREERPRLTGLGFTRQCRADCLPRPETASD
jgi:hypothetical protein